MSSSFFLYLMTFWATLWPLQRPLARSPAHCGWPSPPLRHPVVLASTGSRGGAHGAPEPQLFPSGSPFRSWGPLTRPLHVFGRSTSKTAFRFAAVFTGAECALLPPLDRGLLGARYYFVQGRFSRALSGSFVFSRQVALEPGAARAAEDARSAAAGGTEGP